MLFLLLVDLVFVPAQWSSSVNSFVLKSGDITDCVFSGNVGVEPHVVNTVASVVCVDGERLWFTRSGVCWMWPLVLLNCFPVSISKLGVSASPTTFASIHLFRSGTWA